MREDSFLAEIGAARNALPHPRFEIYRNNVNAALIGALKVRYPVVEQLVGAEFFSAMAAEFVAARKPSSPVLIAYGAEFPAFVGSFVPAQSVAYLGDIARLESLWWQSYHAADALQIPTEVLRDHKPEDWVQTRFLFLPHAALFHSTFTAVSIWTAHQKARLSMAANLITPEYALVHRTDVDVFVRQLKADQHSFFVGLFAGQTMAEAHELALRSSPEFDLAQTLKLLFSLAVVRDIHT